MPRLVYLLFVVFVLRLGAQGDHLLRVHFIDVGQGDAIWIQGPVAPGAASGLNVIIDGGPDKGGNNRLPAYLKHYGLKPGSIIDWVILSHPHDDHYLGLFGIFKDYQVRRTLDSGFPKEGEEFAEFVKAAKEEKVDGKPSEFIELRKNPGLKLDWSPLEARILHADSASLTDMGSGSNRENNASIVLRVAFGKFSFLFMGDAEGKDRDEPADTLRFVEKLLVEGQPKLLPSTVLKAGHHGSETSSTSKFLQAVNPQVVVVMSGRKKFSGTFLPDDTVLARYRAQRSDVTIVRTDQDDEKEGRDTTDDADGDDICIYTDGDSLRVFRAGGPVTKRQWVPVKTIQ